MSSKKSLLILKDFSSDFYREDGKVYIDPDIRIQNAIKTIFETFKKKRTAHGVMVFFREHDIRFPTVMNDKDFYNHDQAKNKGKSEECINNLKKTELFSILFLSIQNFPE